MFVGHTSTYFGREWGASLFMAENVRLIRITYSLTYFVLVLVIQRRLSEVLHKERLVKDRGLLNDPGSYTLTMINLNTSFLMLRHPDNVCGNFSYLSPSCCHFPLIMVHYLNQHYLIDLPVLMTISHICRIQNGSL